MIDKLNQMVANLDFEKNKIIYIQYFIYTLIAVLIVSIFYYIWVKMNLNKWNCTNLKTIYNTFPSISSFNPDDENYKHLLRDYYIKTAYNCCCGGQFKNDFVNTCALKTCLGQGVRCLDFEIYSINNKPVIAASSKDNYTFKEMYNKIALKDALNIINNEGFSGSSCPNPNDPLILHFRIQSNNVKMYDVMADDIYNTIGNKLLSKDYSYQYQGHNLGAVPLNEFVRKIIIVVDRSNPTFENTPLNEYVNIASNSVFMRASREYNIINTPASNELIDYNKKNMTIAMPDLSAYNSNIASTLNQGYGIQMTAMNFQNFDEKLMYYNLFFDNVGSAFVLKPEILRFKPLTIPNPKKQNPAYSYTNREVSSDFYNFQM